MSDTYEPPDGDPAARPAVAQDPPPPEAANPSADLSAEALADGEASGKAEALPEDGPFPWDAESAPDDPDAPRERHDAFTEAKKCVYLRALVKTGCILDACRLTGVNPRTVYRHQENDPGFSDNCRVALRISATPVEITAWRRAVEGVEQEFACGGQVHVRRRYSDGLLRLLLQGSNPKKYGPNPGFKRKQLLKQERKQIEREVRAELEAGLRPRTLDDVRESILRKMEAIARHREPEKLAAGWTKSAEGDWIPPGYAWVGLPEGGGEPGAEEAADGTPRDSV